MGNSSEHLLFAATVGILSLITITEIVVFQPIESATFFVMCLAGALLPDLDLKNSYIFRATKSGLSIGLMAATIILFPGQYYGKFVAGSVVFVSALVFMNSLPTHHRGHFHSIFFVSAASLTIGASLYLFSDSVAAGLGIFVGGLSHLILDEKISLF